MNKKIIFGVAFGMMACAAFGANNWWDMPTICTIDDTRCYPGIRQGLDDSLDTGWDVSGGCRGKKYICASALVGDYDEPVALERAQITSANVRITDFDTNVLVTTDNCYGARKAKNGGAMVSVGGNYVRVWCRDILSNPTEILSNGEITVGAQPTCAALANDGYAAILNDKCYGKYYDPSKYAIECNGENPMLVLLNGAVYNPGGRGMSQSDANSAFGTMVSASARQREIYFNK